MNPVAILAVALFVCGFASAVASLVRYSDFLARLHIVDGALVEKWAIDMNVVDGWSSKNFCIAGYFWRRDYSVIIDDRLRKIGDAVRVAQITAIVLVASGLVLISAKDVFVSAW